MIEIKPKDRDIIIQSLKAGVVPKAGLHLIQVGRKMEVEALIKDMNSVIDGGASFRVVIGDYGAGKTFFLSLARMLAMEKKMVVAMADLNPDRRLQSSTGQAKSLYAELMKNLSTRVKPDGGALVGIVEKFVTTCIGDAKVNGTTPDLEIHKKLEHLSELVNGYDFATVIGKYWEGFQSHDDTLMSNAIRWLRGEYHTKTDARHDLGVRTIVDDESVFDQLKLMARFIRLAGYAGLYVCFDEMVNLYKIQNAQSRNSNYEQILRILNDCLQGNAEGIGVIMGGTVEFLTDERRGLYGYPALKSRLRENEFAINGLTDLSGPVIRLSNLGPEEFMVLLEKIRLVYAGGQENSFLIPDEGITAFMKHCAKKLGARFFTTPREAVVGFVQMLSVLEHNPEAQWQDLIEGDKVELPKAPPLEDDLVEFTLED